MNHLTFVTYIKTGASFTWRRPNGHAVFTMQEKRQSHCTESTMPCIKVGSTYTLRPRTAIYVHDTASIIPTKLERSATDALHFLRKQKQRTVSQTP